MMKFTIQQTKTETSTIVANFQFFHRMGPQKYCKKKNGSIHTRNSSCSFPVYQDW